MEPQLSPGNLLGEIARIVEQFKLPGFDAAAFLDAAHKDIEALVEANRVALAGVQDLAQKQSDILRKTLQELQSLIQEARAAGRIAHSPAQLGDLIQNALKEALDNMRALAELARRSQTEAFHVVSERMQQNMEDLRALLPRKS